MHSHDEDVRFPCRIRTADELNNDVVMCFICIRAVLVLLGKMLKTSFISTVIGTYTMLLLIHPSSTGGVCHVSASPVRHMFNGSFITKITHCSLI